VWAVRKWGSVALFEIASVLDADGGGVTAGASLSKGGQQGLNVTIPLHLRYMTPAVGGYQDASMPYPVVFWACSHSSSSSSSSSDAAASWKPTGNPFDRRYLGYDASFGPDTVFYHVEPQVAITAATSQREPNLTLTMRVPVLDMDKAWYVEPLTAVVVMLGVGWVFWKLFRPLKGVGGQQEKEKEKEKEKEQGRVEGKKVR